MKAKAIAGETTRDRAENMANMTTSLPLRGTIRRVSDREVATRADDELNRGRNPLYVREGARPLIRQVRT
ncbi:MAG: hypothetical protein M0008_06040 [Actinomycetota bacterium]|nr:hypothetical protein [Actinomycetota bacterium]